jgi:hypothetical protein
MGVAMAGMLAAGLRTLPAGVWAVVFGAAALATFAPRTVACCKVAMGVTMGYMLIAMA